MQVYGDAAFWRLLVISLIVALGTRATFRHLDATFPKYMVRQFGADTPHDAPVEDLTLAPLEGAAPTRPPGGSRASGCSVRRRERRPSRSEACRGLSGARLRSRLRCVKSLGLSASTAGTGVSSRSTRC